MCDTVCVCVCVSVRVCLLLLTFKITHLGLREKFCLKVNQIKHTAAAQAHRLRREESEEERRNKKREGVGEGKKEKGRRGD